MLGDAHALYRGLCDHSRDGGDKDKDKHRDNGGVHLAVSMVDVEADYLQLLLGHKGSDEVMCDGENTPLCCVLMLIRSVGGSSLGFN